MNDVRVGRFGVLEMIDTFDRPGDAYAMGTYAGAGSYANGCEKKTGRRLPKAGLYAGAGVGHARAEWSVFEADAKGPNASAGIEASTSYLGAKAFAKAELGSASASAGPLKAKVGLAVDTGAAVGLTGIEAKFLGTGFSFGQRMSISLLGNEVEFNFL